MSALDLAHFKKIGQDKKCATLQHPDGHEIKIAIASLNPSLKKQLEELPLHQARGSEEPVEPLDDESPAVAQDAPAVEDPEVKVTEEVKPEVPAPVAAPPQAEPAGPQSVEAPPPQPASQPMTITAKAPTPEEEALAKTDENMKVGQDLSNGHIQPKTYRDLFNDKSTLGKVGTIFGLMLSGAGAGLTHQPNALLAMMDKQIANDLEAQKTNQTNKQNWYRASLEHLRTNAQNDLTRAQALDTATEAERKQYANIENGVMDREASTYAKNNMRLAALQSNQLHINAMPPGQQRDNAQAIQNANMIAAQHAIHADNVKTAQETKPARDQLKNMQTNPSKPKKAVEKTAEAVVDAGPIDQHTYQNMVKKGKFMSTSGFVDPSKGIDPADNGSVEKAITESQVNWKNYKDAMEVANALAKMPRAGQTPVGALADVAKKIPWIGEATAGLLHMGQASAERDRQVLVDALATRLSSNGASNKTIDEVKNALTPNMFDNEKTLKSLQKVMYQHFAHNDKEQSAMFTKYPKIKKPLPEIEIKEGGALESGSKKRHGAVEGLNKTLGDTQSVITGVK